MIHSLPEDIVGLQKRWQKQAATIKGNYLSDTTSWLLGLLPSEAVKLPAREVIALLQNKLEGDFLDVINPDYDFPSPVEGEEDSLWMQSTNMLGVNVRTIDNFFNVVKYALTLPAHIDSIHLLPIWQPGVVGSLYGIASKNINTEFFSEELYQLYPHLDTSERQLKVVINLLHALGKTVGMDVIPHTDRYSELVLANPAYFEWLQRVDKKIVNHVEDLHLEVQELIFECLGTIGSANPAYQLPQTAGAFFSIQIPEDKRTEILFGTKDDVLNRNERRKLLIDVLYKKGYEPLPATMAPPYRGLQVCQDDKAATIDEYNRLWRDYEMTKPQEMSRVFGPLTRFKFYERKNNNRDWEIDFDKPRVEVWEYFVDFYVEQALKFRFDFMRGDMAHVQMRPTGVPLEVDEYYDPLKTVKNRVAEEKNYFGYTAEAFLVQADYMAYGDEIDHIEMSDADSALGNLQSMVPGSMEFLQAFRQYRDILTTRYTAPSFAVMTADKDDPRFDAFYLEGNEARLFTALFLTDMPSYNTLGFELRDAHLQAAPNEYYTKLYVFQLKEGPKATLSAYKWGENAVLFQKLTRIHLFFESVKDKIEGQESHFLIAPDATGHKKYIAWTQVTEPTYLLIVNWSKLPVKNIKIPAIWEYEGRPNPVFSTEIQDAQQLPSLKFNGYNYSINELLPGEGRVYKL